MATARDVIQDALEMLQVYAPGETMSDADAERGLGVLNDMLDSWSNESLACYQINQQSVALTVGKATYTIGTSGGADINLTRPLKILDQPGNAFVLDSNSNKTWLDVLPIDLWGQIPNWSSSVTANIPNALFYDPAFPLGTLKFSPFPNTAGYTAYWNSEIQLSTFATLSAALSLPPGYKRALGTNLAVEIKPYFLTGQLDPAIISSASISKANIKRTNIRPLTAGFDREIVSRATGTYNIYTDSQAPR
jgi:hypothetical protein